jgi:type I restriction-modification system DNA methylase subunit
LNPGFGVPPARGLGLADVEPDIIGRSYEYLIRKFAEGSVSSAGEFYTPTKVGFVLAPTRSLAVLVGGSWL